MKSIEVRDSLIDGAGNGVFATVDIPQHEIFESAPVTLMSNDTFDILHDYFGAAHILNNYVFTSQGHPMAAMAWGYGSMYNHAEKKETNAVWKPNITSSGEWKSIYYISKRKILANEEILINYFDGAFIDLHGNFAKRRSSDTQVGIKY